LPARGEITMVLSLFYSFASPDLNRTFLRSQARFHFPDVSCVLGDVASDGELPAPATLKMALRTPTTLGRARLAGITISTE
jgi:hypothetical protein